MSNYFSQKANILSGIYLNTWTVSVYAFTITVANATVIVNVDTNGCKCNRYCTLSTISGTLVDYMCIINAYCSQCRILFLDIRH